MLRDDGALDADGDGLSNAAEFAAGTDPHDPTSNLRIPSIGTTSNFVALQFEVVSNRTYAVQARSVQDQFWQTASEIPASSSTRTIEMFYPLATNGLYRLMTPRVP